MKFPKSSRGSNLPQNYFEIEREIKEMKWKKERTVEDMQREQVLLERARFNFDLKKQGYMMFLAQSSTYATQVMKQLLSRLAICWSLVNSEQFVLLIVSRQ